MNFKTLLLTFKNNFQKSTNSQSLSIVLFFLFVFGLFYIATYTYENLYLDIYTQRDIMRAIGWLNGKIYWPGPEMSPGSQLPGPFFYFLLIPPLLFGTKIYTQILIWRIIWLALTYTTAFYFANKICKCKRSLFIFIMFLIACIGPSLFLPLSFAFNPTFSIMFHILAVIALYTWKETSHNKYLYFLGLIIGVGMQVHALLIVHILTAFVFWITDKDKTWKTLLWFISLIVLPCLPYFVMYSFNWLDTSHYQAAYYFKQTFWSKTWEININAITSFKPYLAGPFLLFILLFFNRIRLKKKFPFSRDSINLFIITVIPVCISLLVADSRGWYLYFIPLFLILLFTKLWDEFISNKTNKELNHLVIYGILFIFPLLINGQGIPFPSVQLSHLFLFLILSSLVFLMISKITLHNLWKVWFLLFISCFHFFTKEYKVFNRIHFNTLSHIPTFPKDNFVDNWILYYIQSNYNLLKPLLQKIALDTNWPTQTAIKRIYKIAVVHSTLSLPAYYSLVKEQLDERIQEKISPKADGYFIVEHLNRFVDYTQSEWKKYLSHSPYVSSSIQEEIKTKKLFLQTPKLYNRYWLIPYKITEQSIFLEGFYNIGQSYSFEEPLWLTTCPYTKHFSKGSEDFYYCMILPGFLQRAGVHITFSKGLSQAFMELSFFGPLLGIKEKDANTDGHAYWSDIQVTLFCNNKQFIHSMPDMGHYLKRYHDLIAESSLSTPLKLKIPLQCEKSKISKMTLRFKHFKRSNKIYSESSPEQKNITWRF